MKRKWFLLIPVLVLVLLFLLGIGPYSSSSAVADLHSQLESMYGPEYSGKVLENGTEDMTFSVEPKSWFLTNWSLRNALGIPYRYECQVIFTTKTGDAPATVRTITYQATDPMGSASQTARATLDPDSRTESIAITVTTK